MYFNTNSMNFPVISSQLDIISIANQPRPPGNLYTHFRGQFGFIELESEKCKEFKIQFRKFSSITIIRPEDLNLPGCSTLGCDEH